ncbi:hypothetical protein BDP81DRAFT_103360 [Colletotrichum phormii]|uniref:Uncharacterized protein n=1 Tax=Colletotrichum phormii TaxID=359342 RepID=A0AAJ0EAU4_9PEZI|nr:uncharacterized protein BDP81DRAFT_103360 [Colletotrichum phormii]KAK1624946.1 hypothetical protein BDP81DRAFT_103360 [Colletotrichum phormii]
MPAGGCFSTVWQRERETERERVKRKETRKKKACERSTAAQIPQTLTRRRSFPTFQPHHHQPDRFPAGDEDPPPRCNRHPTSRSHSASVPNSSIAKTLSLSLSVPCNQRTCQKVLDAGRMWPNACMSSFSRFGLYRLHKRGRLIKDMHMPHRLSPNGTVGE